MDDVRTQLELTNEINDAISNPAAMGIDVRSQSLCLSLTVYVTHLQSVDEQVDASELEDELAELEQEELNKRLAGADAAPLHSPGVSTSGAFHCLRADIEAGRARVTSRRRTRCSGCLAE